MYVVYLNAELYGVTDSREKAYNTILSFITTEFKKEKFLDELIEQLKYSFWTGEVDLTDGGDCWTEYTENIF